MTASEAITPGPPALVIMAMFGPLGSGCFLWLRRSWISRQYPLPNDSCPFESSIIYHVFARNSSVCEAAAFALSVDLPDFTTIIGLVLEKCLAALMNFPGICYPFDVHNNASRFGSVQNNLSCRKITSIIEPLTRNYWILCSHEWPGQELLNPGPLWERM